MTLPENKVQEKKEQSKVVGGFFFLISSLGGTPVVACNCRSTENLGERQQTVGREF